MGRKSHSTAPASSSSALVWWSLGVVGALLVAGCGETGGGRYYGGDSDGGMEADDLGAGDDAGGLRRDLAMGGGKPDLAQQGTPDLAMGTCNNIVGSRRDQVCLRWTCDRRDRSEGAFNGDINNCSPGTLPAIARTNTMKILNLYRFLAGLPEVTDDATRGTKAQACSLMMDANNALSHTPPQNWKCYTTDGATAAGSSNISTAAAVSSTDLYMIDFGNATTIGHRRWLMSNSLGPVGVGSAPGGSCLWVIGGSGRAAKTWLAWPPPGPVPFE